MPTIMPIRLHVGVGKMLRLSVHVKYWIEQTYGTSCVSVGMPIKTEWRKRKWEQKMRSSEISHKI